MEGASLLTMTSSAASVVSDIRANQGIPDDAVLRVFPDATPDGVAIRMSFAPEPASGDDVCEVEGTTLCVDHDLAEPLGSSVIDTEDAPEGRRLVIRA